MTPSKDAHPVVGQRARALVQNLHAAKLADAGEARTSALTLADQELNRIARLLPGALESGLSLTEIARLTGVSRPTLYELRGRYGDSMHLSLALLQTVASNSPVPAAELRRRLGRPTKDVERVLGSFVEQGFIAHVLTSGDAGPEPVYAVTGKGLDLLEHWSDEEELADEKAQGGRQ